MADNSKAIWREYYQKSLTRPHSKRTEFIIQHNESNSNIAIDCGCGTGADIDFLVQKNYNVYGFDINPDSIELCKARFATEPLANISLSSFEHYEYPKAGVIIANSSLFFSQASSFHETWGRIESSLLIGGVFAGDFLGVKDSWAFNYHGPTNSLTKDQVEELFTNFDIIRFNERDEDATTSLGKMKHWHTFSIIAIKRR
ncbi:methyltransferase domain-containing protein [Vibrio sp. WJH972]